MCGRKEASILEDNYSRSLRNSWGLQRRNYQGLTTSAVIEHNKVQPAVFSRAANETEARNRPQGAADIGANDHNMMRTAPPESDGSRLGVFSLSYETFLVVVIVSISRSSCSSIETNNFNLTFHFDLSSCGLLYAFRSPLLFDLLHRFRPHRHSNSQLPAFSGVSTSSTQSCSTSYFPLPSNSGRESGLPTRWSL